MGKCHLMLAQCTLEDIKLYNEELERQEEAQHPFYIEQNQLEYQRRWEESLRDFDSEIDAILYAQPGHDTIPTGDSALDDDTEYYSDMDDCLIPCEEELSSDQEFEAAEEALSTIDFSEEINLNDLY